MTNPLNFPDDERGALLTAYALNQLTGAEQATVKASLADDIAGQAFVEQTRRLAGIVEGALSSEASPVVSTALRSEIDERLMVREVIAKPLPAAITKRSWRREIIIGTIAGGLLAALLVPGVRSGLSDRLAFRASGGPSAEHAKRTATESQRSSSTPQSGRLPAPRATLWNEQQPVESKPSDADYAGDANFATPAITYSHDGEAGSGVADQTASPDTKEWKELTRRTRSQAKAELKTKPTGAMGNHSGRSPSPGAPVHTAPGQGQPAAESRFGDQASAEGLSEESGKVEPYSARPAAAPVNNPTPRPRGLSAAATPAERRYMFGVGVNSDAGVAGSIVPTDALLTQQTRLRAAAAADEGETAEQYDQIVENSFLPSKDHALSTFSIDVDTASYANTRRFLTGGQLPPPSAVRIEELINYFTYDDPQPEGNGPFSVNMELAECPWTPGHHLLRVGLKGREIAKDKRPNSNLVFLLDVSGSMQTHNKLPLVKQAMQMLVRQLTENDMVTIVVYAGQEGLALDTTSGDQKDKILGAIENLAAGGSTHASAGITLAYEKAMQNFLKDGTNRVILCTDGDFNVGITDDQALVNLISEKAKSNVFLSVLGFGMGNLKDSKMEKLADKGNGNYGYIDTAKEAQKVLVEQMTGSLITIAKDVKIQIEFNPAAISSYRQIGYENRVLAAKDFDDDTKDAGEIGAGHSVTALYEVVLVGNEKTAAQPGQEAGVPLKYQRPVAKPEEARPATDRELTEAAQTGELCTVKLRFKEPTGDKSELMEFPLKQEPKRFGAASENLRFASAVAAFGMVLRGSEHRGGASMSAVEEIASASLGKDANGYRAEFLDLIRKARQLGK